MVAVASVKGAPGATTVAAGLAACWVGGPGLLVEADPHGGDLAARFGHADTPGLSSAAAAARHGTGPGWLDGHVQRLPLEVDVLLAPASAQPASAALTVLAGHLDAVRAAAPVVVVDAGRLVPSSAAGPFVEAADVVLIVAAPRLDCLSHVAARLSAMAPPLRGRVRLVLAAEGDYPASEIDRDLGVPVTVSLPRDPRGAGVLAGRHRVVRGWRRLGLPRAVAHLSATLATMPGPGSVVPRLQVEVPA